MNMPGAQPNGLHPTQFLIFLIFPGLHFPPKARRWIAVAQVHRGSSRPLVAPRLRLASNRGHPRSLPHAAYPASPARPRQARIRLLGSGTAVGPATVPVKSRLKLPSGNGSKVSREMPLDATVTRPLTAPSAKTRKPSTCLSVEKFPVPGPTWGPLHLRPASEHLRVHLRLVVLRFPLGKSVEVGPAVLVTPNSPVSVIVVVGWKIE